MKKVLLAVAWLWVAVPLSWGVFQSIQKSLPLFDGTLSPVTAVPQVEPPIANR